MAHKFTIFLPH